MAKEKAERLTEMSIVITRQLFARMSEAPMAIAFMTYYDIAPEEIEDKIYQILEYREQADPEVEAE